MCSIEEDELVREIAEPNALCLKCKVEDGVIRVRVSFYCEKCFLQYYVHKFRATLGKSKIFRTQSEKVLVAFSGGAASCSLLDLIHESLKDDQPKKLPIVPFVCHIDESCLFDYDLMDIKKLIHSYGFENVVIDLQSIYTPDAQPSLKLFFQNVSSATARQDFLEIFKRHLLLKAAHDHGCSKIFMAESATRLATQTLASTCKARGAMLAADSGFEQKFDSENLSIFRPLKELLSSEIDSYNAVRKLQSLSYNTFATTTRSSIDSLTEHFILNLQKDYPSTVDTISCTADKIQMENKTTVKCPLCLTNYWQRLENIPSLRRSLSYFQPRSSVCPSCSTIVREMNCMEECLLPSAISSILMPTI